MDFIFSGGAFLYAAAAGCLLGIALALMFGFGLVAGGIFICCAAIGLLFASIKRSPTVIIIAIFCASLALGVIRTDAFLSAAAQENLPTFAGQTVQVKGVVVNDPDRRDTSLHININVASVNDAPAQGTLLAILDRNEKVSYGDTVVVEGTLEVPQPFDTDTGHTFDYPGYLRAQGISMQLQRGAVLNDTPAGFSLQGFLFDTKHMFERSTDRVFSEPENSLLEGILLGERRGIPKELNNAFIKSGLVHVVVLSGHNITIVSEGVFRMLSFLPRTFSFSLGGVMMILFALMTGAGATTIRALAMALIALLARYMHRSALALRSLAVAAAAMALWNPEALLHDPSFILSVLATFGLITLSPSVEQHLPRFLVKYPSIRSIAATTISVQLFVLPALLYFTGVLSFLALPANILALPVVPLAMLMGFIAGILGLVHPALAFAPALLCDVLLKWMILIANTATTIPYGSTVIPEFSSWIMVAVYIPLTLFAVFIYSRSQTASLPHSNSNF